MASLHGWHVLHDGREGLYLDGVCCAAIAHLPERRTPFATDNLDTRADAMAQCERVTGSRGATR